MPIAAQKYKLSLAGLLAALSFCHAAAQTTAGSLRPAVSAKQELILKLAKRRFAAFVAGDRNAYRELVANDATFAYSDGRFLDASEAFKELGSVFPANYKFAAEYDEIRFHDFGNSAQIVYRLVFTDAQNRRYQYRESDTFALRDSKWKPVAVQGTPIP